MGNFFINDEPEKVEEKVIDVVENNTDRFESKDIVNLTNIKQIYSSEKKLFGKFKPSSVIFDGLNLTIKDKKDEGQFIVIMGKSGSGKSTILRYISGLQKPTEGNILIYGKSLEEYGNIPMVFQQYSSFPWMSVEQNVGLSLTMNSDLSQKQIMEKVSEIIRIVGLEGQEKKWAKYPILSGGQLQRVAIARNLIASPQILLMDEPFGALDTVTRSQMQIFLRNIYEHSELDPTVILVTHDVREAVFLATDIIILGDKPSNVKYHLPINLPLIRDLSVKRLSQYQEYVNLVEDYMETC